MTNSELKQMLSNAYHTDASENQKKFIRKYNRRQLNFFELLAIQIKYMNMQYIAPLPAVVGILLALAVKRNESVIYYVSSFLPFLALVSLTGLGKAQRCGMSELESSTRFSSRMIKALRLLLAGFIGFVMVSISFFALRSVCAISVPTALFVSAFPYIITAAASMILVRKWHEKENIYGCVVISTAVCICSLICGSRLAVTGVFLSSMVEILIFVAVTFLLFREAYIFVNESEELQWNLC